MIDLKHQELYRAANELMAIIGMNGSIEARSQEADAVMEALYAIDGGNPLTQPAASQIKPLTDVEIEAIGHRKASTYTHRSDPTSHAYGFVRHTLIDFARALIAEQGKRQPQWLPIADAPKGGAEYWATDGTHYFTESQPPKCFPGQWRWFEQERCWGGSMSTYKASHFMPLPLPPTATPQGNL